MRGEEREAHAAPNERRQRRQQRRVSSRVQAAPGPEQRAELGGRKAEQLAARQVLHLPYDRARWRQLQRRQSPSGGAQAARLHHRGILICQLYQQGGQRPGAAAAGRGSRLQQPPAGGDLYRGGYLAPAKVARVAQQQLVQLPRRAALRDAAKQGIGAAGTAGAASPAVVVATAPSPVTARRSAASSSLTSLLCAGGEASDAACLPARRLAAVNCNDRYASSSGGGAGHPRDRSNGSGRPAHKNAALELQSGWFGRR